MGIDVGCSMGERFFEVVITGGGVFELPMGVIKMVPEE